MTATDRVRAERRRAPARPSSPSAAVVRAARRSCSPAPPSAPSSARVPASRGSIPRLASLLQKSGVATPCFALRSRFAALDLAALVIGQVCGAGGAYPTTNLVLLWDQLELNLGNGLMRRNGPEDGEQQIPQPN